MILIIVKLIFTAQKWWLLFKIDGHDPTNDIFSTKKLQWNDKNKTFHPRITPYPIPWQPSAKNKTIKEEEEVTSQTAFTYFRRT